VGREEGKNEDLCICFMKRREMFCFVFEFYCGFLMIVGLFFGLAVLLVILLHRVHRCAGILLNFGIILGCVYLEHARSCGLRWWLDAILSFLSVLTSTCEKIFFFESRDNIFRCHTQIPAGPQRASGRALPGGREACQRGGRQ